MQVNSDRTDYTKTSHVIRRIYTRLHRLNGIAWVNARLLRRILERFLDETHHSHSIAPRVLKVDGHFTVLSYDKREGFVEPPEYRVTFRLDSPLF